MNINEETMLGKIRRIIWEPMDPWLFYAMLAIYIMSLFLLYSADGQAIDQLENKTIHTILAFILLWFIARARPQVLASFALPMYATGVILLLGVHFFGVTVNGSTRWLNIGIGRIQPSEIMKIALPMMVAWYFQKYEMSLRWYHYLGALMLVLVPGALILKQPDLGTATLIMASGLFVIFFAGLPWKVIFTAIIGFMAALPLIWNYGMHDYQKTRVMTLLDPTQDPLGAGYHIIQSMIAIGSGGIWGKGWLNGTQTHLDYIPEATTDFIFAVYGEEFGLIGNVLLLVIYLLILGRGLYIAAKAPTLYSRTLAGALTMTFFCYAFVNMGMVSGILPVVGVPLPLVSYGGTATLSIMVVLALLMSIGNQRRN
ncbi:MULTISPECIES: rod shape-determining protein RodA [unclassified Neisseria]|uniref:rod shape-determining protein RodA n=1 Tax=unclassified Neisseria TaxID=2623750 RepID=UPI0026669089|nr:MULTISPECIES: rod shape-determining protein RodA [unclassified Neisseria]MDO1509326.1 rod shape-determining protein RodA [Neisseria sp. MVDL19-042950]MDO1515395.1 rod shape-determining protein RodA [Neisseria sp. MVDL18-041461]MDO1562755.1 rod shape-determining protein RodA [Neisseria sp. MVDL20-010259]